MTNPTNPERVSVHIAAGGHSTRLREVMNSHGLPPDYPKHLLPTGGRGGETFLGRIVHQAMDAPVEGQPTVYVNVNNAPQIVDHPNIHPLANVVEAEFDNSFGPFVQNLLNNEQRTLGSAGDLYTTCPWDEMLSAHESNKYPVTLMVGQSVAVEKGAVFTLADDGRLTSFARTAKTREADMINIGVYIFDPQKEVLKIMGEVARARGLASREEAIVERLIERQLAGAHVVQGSFNINTPETYEALLAETTGRQLAKRPTAHQRVLAMLAILPPIEPEPVF